MTGEITKVDLSKSEAKSLTDKIRESVDGIKDLLEQAFDRKAWKALGYKNWDAYIAAEFHMTRQNAYRILTQAKADKALASVVGENVTHALQISQRDAAVISDDLPSVTAEIKSRIEQGEKPEKAVADVVAEKHEERQARGKKPVDAEWEQRRQANADALPQHVKDREAHKSKPRTGLSDAERIAELEEAVRVLEAENAALKSENKTFSEMKVQFEKGGFEAVIAGKDERIKNLNRQVEREGEQKVANLRRADRYYKILKDKYHHFDDVVLKLDEPTNG